MVGWRSLLPLTARAVGTRFCRHDGQGGRRPARRLQAGLTTFGLAPDSSRASSISPWVGWFWGRGWWSCRRAVGCRPAQVLVAAAVHRENSGGDDVPGGIPDTDRRRRGPPARPQQGGRLTIGYGLSWRATGALAGDGRNDQ